MKRVLILEDDPVLLMALQTFVAGAGYEVSCAANVAQARALAAQWRPNLLLADHYLPDGTGADAASALPGVPCVFLTAASHEDMARLEAAFPGAVVLRKPTPRTALLAVLAGVLRGP